MRRTRENAWESHVLLLVVVFVFAAGDVCGAMGAAFPWGAPMRFRFTTGCLLIVLFGACAGEIMTSTGASPDESPLGSTSERPRGTAGGQTNSPDPTAPTPASCGKGSPQVGPSFTRRLLASELRQSIRDLLGVEPPLDIDLGPEGTVGPFRSNEKIEITDTGASLYMELAEAVAGKAVADLPALLSCAEPSLDCVRDFVSRFGRRAFRRPLTEGEVKVFMTLYEGTTSGPKDGVARVIEAFLQSPYFLYLRERGETAPEAPGLKRLTADELAGRLSLFLWKSVPDEQLIAKADDKSLLKPATLEVEVRRMLGDKRAKRGLHEFHFELLGLAELDRLEKDPMVYPRFKPELRDSMRLEAELFVDHIFSTTGSLEAMLTAPWAFVDPALASYYGITAGAPEQPVKMPPEKRAGILTLGGVMASHATIDQTSPILRGLLVQGSFTCVTIAPPPPGLATEDPPRKEGVSRRAQFEMHSSGACAGCHRLIDPPGFAFENFDGAGRHQLEDEGGPIDARGELFGTDVDGPFNGALELSQRLSRSAQVKGCMARQWFRFALGRDPADDDACSLSSARDRLLATGDLRELIVGIATSDTFRYRHP
jgi:hypothetical protein